MLVGRSRNQGGAAMWVVLHPVLAMKMQHRTGSFWVVPDAIVISVARGTYTGHPRTRRIPTRSPALGCQPPSPVASDFTGRATTPPSCFKVLDRGEPVLLGGLGTRCASGDYLSRLVSDEACRDDLANTLQRLSGENAVVQTKCPRRAGFGGIHLVVAVRV